MLYNPDCRCGSWYIGKAIQRLDARIKQHISANILEPGHDAKKKTTKQKKRKENKEKEEGEELPADDSANGEHLVANVGYLNAYDRKQFTLLTAAWTQTKLHTLEALLEFARQSGPSLLTPPPPPPSLSLSLSSQASDPKLAWSRSAAERCMLSEKVYIEQCMQLTRTQTGRAMSRCLSPHWSLTFCTLNSFKLCTHQWMCSSSDTPAFRSFFISFHLFKHLDCVMEEEKKKQEHLGSRIERLSNPFFLFLL